MTEQRKDTGADQPRVSVVIPFFANHDRLEICLESIIAHVSGPYEILLIDDANRDFDFSAALRIPHLKLIQLGTSSGPGAARNAALDVASGTYLLFLDSDDRLCGDTATYFAALTPNMSLPDVIIGVLEGANLLPAFQTCAPFTTSLENEIKLAKLGTFTAHLYRTAFIRQHGIRFPTGITSAEDTVFLLRALSSAQQILVTDTSVYRVYERPDSLSRQAFDMANFRERFSVAATLIETSLAAHPPAKAARMSMVFKYALKMVTKLLPSLTDDERTEAFDILRTRLNTCDLLGDAAANARTAASVYWDSEIDEIARLLQGQDNNLLQALIKQENLRLF